MRRTALSAPCLLLAASMLSGCSGFGTFLADVHGFNWSPNRPIGDSENIRRVKGMGADVVPLKPEEGNVWPGPAAPPPTLQDLEKQQNDLGQQPGAGAPLGSGTSGSGTPGSGTSGAAPAPFAPDHRQPVPGDSNQPGLPSPISGPPPVRQRSSVPGAGPSGPISQTPGGPSVNTRGPGINNPVGNGSIVVPNGNGTSTVISPDGSISTVPTPK